MATPNTQSIQVITNLITAAQQLMALYDLMVTVDQQWTDWDAADITAAMKTVVMNADGTMGAPDATPITSHPIDMSAYPLPRAISSLQISQIKTIVDGVVNYVDGKAVTTQPGARAILNVAVGG